MSVNWTATFVLWLVVLLVVLGLAWGVSRLYRRR